MRYGLVRDTGKDDTPVPQYVTRCDPGRPGDGRPGQRDS